MKGWTSVLNVFFVILDWLAHILLSPMTVTIALGFVLFTAIIGRQIRNDSAARWARAA